jgi:branched-chain amino acid transport system permease protein
MSEPLVCMLQLLITGIAVGGVYALMALGFVLIYKASNVVNFGPGELVLFGAYVSWATILQMRFPLYVAFPLTLLTSIALGLIIERGVLRPLIGQPIISVIMVTFGFASVIRGVLNMVGVSVKRMFALSWCIATVVSTLGGIILGSVRGGVDFSLAELGLKVFPVVILGGLDSVMGAIVGGVLIGVLENLSGGYLDPIFGGGVKEVAPFVVLVVILLFRPYGLFGKPEIERV